ncbi:MAG TPA: hypothetical protein VGE59_00085 [Patescibacteria group bacterium]
MSLMPAEQEFLEHTERSADEYPLEWREHIEAWPEEHRDHLVKILEANAERGDFSPELYRELGVTFEAVDKDEEMTYRGFEGRYKAAEAYTRSRRVRVFPELQRYSERMVGHVLRHELGHFLGEHCIDPSQYFSFVSHRPNWANSRYIRQVSQGDETLTVGQIMHESSPELFLHEMLADDIADYLGAKTPEEMLASRLERAGSQADIEMWAQTYPEDFAYLEEEASDLFLFFQESFSRSAEERLADAPGLAAEWRRFNEVEDDDDEDPSVAVTSEVAQPLWSPPAPRPPKKEGTGFFSWLFGL